MGDKPTHIEERARSFLYQAESWKTARRVVAKVEFHAGVPPESLGRDEG
jgi:hypothetical protein